MERFGESCGRGERRLVLDGRVRRRVGVSGRGRRQRRAPLGHHHRLVPVRERRREVGRVAGGGRELVRVRGSGVCESVLLGRGRPGARGSLRGGGPLTLVEVEVGVVLGGRGRAVGLGPGEVGLVGGVQRGRLEDRRERSLERRRGCGGLQQDRKRYIVSRCCQEIGILLSGDMGLCTHGGRRGPSLEQGSGGLGRGSGRGGG